VKIVEKPPVVPEQIQSAKSLEQVSSFSGDANEIAARLDKFEEWQK